MKHSRIGAARLKWVAMEGVAEQQYQAHLRSVAAQWEQALEAAGFAAAIVAAGVPQRHLFDDLEAFFRPNPHFALWFPHRGCVGAALFFAPGRRPKLYFHRPEDYWHLPPDLPDWAAAHFELAVFADSEQLEEALRRDAKRLQTAFIGERAPASLNAELNPASLVNRLHHQRAWKTDFEVACLRQATASGVAGHLAARDAYYDGGSEFDILSAYLSASKQTEADLPYPCIVGLDEHAAVLHYQHYGRSRPPGSRVLLIDAGASCRGYGCDITRTWATPEAGAFAELIDALDEQQRGLIDTIEPGLHYVDLHLAMHRRLCELLHRFGLVKCSAAAAFEQGVSQTFMPHGLGHLLGLQTHDVGGWQSSPQGDEAPPPKGHETLRLTRSIEAGMVFTVEPGLYFIPMLLRELRTQPGGAEVNWPLVESLTPCGGVRIEDNVLVTADGASNLTRAAFAQAQRTA